MPVLKRCNMGLSKQVMFGRMREKSAWGRGDTEKMDWGER